jgi:beta-N-acetylhexosaminidase
MRILLDECPAGGIILFRYNLDTGADEIRSLIDGCAAIIKSGTEAKAPAAIRGGIPPLVAVDHEGGTVNRFNSGVASLPAASSYWRRLELDGIARDETLAQLEADAFRAGAEIKGFGINMNLAPVAEYLTGDNRGFLEDRSYGPDPAFTAAAAAAFIRGMGRAGILCAVKHFPGSAGPDPHRFSSALSGNKASLDALTSPFAELIRGGNVRALMAAHTLVPALDSARIASLSPAVMKNWLRGELKFGGIIIADDFSMAAAGSRLRTETAAVQALAAGADMALVWPPDIRKTHRAIQSALADGTLPRERLREAAARIIFEKLRMELLNDE